MAGTLALTSNVLPVGIAAETFTAWAWARPLGDDEDLRALREAAAPRWSVQLEEGRSSSSRSPMMPTPYPAPTSSSSRLPTTFVSSPA
jgi:hypothetical protein